MPVDLPQLEAALAPLLAVHGVDCVALEWFQGQGSGILRLTIDRPGTDPRAIDPALGLSMDTVSDVTRDVSTTLDALDAIAHAYTLEVGSPGLERPVQKRADFERFAGLPCRMEVREPGGGRRAHMGVLAGTEDLPNGDFAVRLQVQGAPGPRSFPHAAVVRAKLLEIKQPPKPKPGKGPSQRDRKKKDAAASHAPVADGSAARGTDPKPDTSNSTKDRTGPRQDARTPATR